MYNAIVFDFDGVICEGIPWHDEVFMKTFKSIGINLDLEYLHTKIGKTVKQVITDILEDANVKLDIDELVKEHIENTYNVYNEKAVIPDGLIDFLQNCKKVGLKIGIASGSPSNILKMVLNKFGINEYFEVIIGGEMISKGKPDPEMIQKALDSMGIEPSRAIAIDDARSGIIAAKKINMLAIGYLEHSKKEIEEADINVYHFKDIEIDEIIKSLI